MQGALQVTDAGEHRRGKGAEAANLVIIAFATISTGATLVAGVARVATDLFLKQTDARLTLFLRNARRLKLTGHADRVRVVEGDVLDAKTLESAMAGQNVVYANLAGQLEQQARSIVTAMKKAGLKRLIFISLMGSRGESQVPPLLAVRE